MNRSITKNFGGKVYYFNKGFMTKTDAEKFKNKIKSNDGLARIIPTGMNKKSAYKYLVFTRLNP